MNAGLILFLWMAAVCLVQLAEGGWLAALTAMSLAVALFCARAHCLRLLARIRLLLLAMLVLFAWFTPGMAVFMDWPGLSPSREGLLLALVHGARLTAVVCWVAILLARMPADRLVSGLYALLRPCSVLGVPAERVALRLLLVLRFVDEARAGGRNWRYWLDESFVQTEPVRLVREQAGFRDAAALAVTGCALVLWWWLR
ncbi:MAG: energy-coupling factor transporter transmembrane protein EcfT [Azoarcus sp.]|jgi:energy-coupling factor transporter transmembrane protein EcfT|nr:energy-coupling factor transporter transmembrane protein EcfT [Azoarcus sp.]